MKIENKVVSLKTAKLLKEKGFPQDTERWWFSPNGSEWSLGGAFSSMPDGNIAAPDAQEIGELFPRNLGSKLFIQLRKSGWLVRVDGHEVLHENEAEARASVWLYLKENKLI